VLDHLDALNFTDAMREELDQVTDAVDLETLKDFFLNTQFRRDLFVRDAERPTDRIATLLNVPLAAAVLPANVRHVAGSTALGEFRPRLDVMEAVTTVLAEGPASSIELMAHPAVNQMAPDVVLETLLQMAALGAADPAMPAANLAARKVHTDALNAALWARSLLRDEVHATASPVTGGGVGLPRMEQLFLLARHRDVDAVDMALGAMPGEKRSDVARAYDAFVTNRIPLLKNLGIGS
jgi:hypothetical protein